MTKEELLDKRTFIDLFSMTNDIEQAEKDLHRTARRQESCRISGRTKDSVFLGGKHLCGKGEKTYARTQRVLRGRRLRKGRVPTLSRPGYSI